MQSNIDETLTIDFTSFYCILFFVGVISYNFLDNIYKNVYIF